MNYEAFGRAMYKLLSEWPGWFGDEWSEIVMPLAVKAGLAHEVPYDPDIHDCDDGAEPGEEIWVWRSDTEDEE